MNVGLIIVGDEILSGKRQDKHLARVIEALATRGMSLSWARYVGDERPGITQALRDAFASATGVVMPEASYSRLHRWRYALPTEPLPERCLWDASNGVGACGDWCAGPRVEGAYLSGIAVAERALSWLAEGAPSRAGRS